MVDRTTLMTRELESHEFIPYGRHTDAHTITVGTQGLMTMVEIEGFAFETADPRDINGLQARLNTLWRNIADPRLALYTLLIRRRVHRYPGGTSGSPFAAALDARYQARLKGEALFENRQILALVWMPGTDAERTASALFASLRRARGATRPPRRTKPGTIFWPRRPFRNMPAAIAPSARPRPTPSRSFTARTLFHSRLGPTRCRASIAVFRASRNARMKSA